MADLDTAQLLAALEPVAEDNLNRHLNVAQEWMPHEYVPWSLGRDFKELGGDPWSVDQSQLSQIARTARRGVPGSTAGPPRRAGTRSASATTCS